jgi:hypothetical protein
VVSMYSCRIVTGTSGRDYTSTSGCGYTGPRLWVIDELHGGEPGLAAVAFLLLVRLAPGAFTRPLLSST